MAADTRRSVLDFLVERHLSLVAPLLRSWLEAIARAEDSGRARDAAVRCSGMTQLVVAAM